ncbi:15-hydroxyprostaglandin dehydrogenase [NAD(+)]-like [Belonocnema kinseyi]|uniref:15-hydroxyprostaglandin dehydrogenase [NAD(+)]-like n=1 Tax=Belonocnema kinseyi TaxID=2817044 RepID=UPI00143D0BE6|nr:15-hydroxyprostaglandin dehydrogenase [NAD(+)]-like [Belonocnema kinseyi]XP_033228060.1 15-hydroxyprostaglandin dehydrogenase [NAD(+)]-like [Belonocnema kinseyi]
MEVKDKSAIVTGGASGIGFSVVQELLRKGVKLVIILDLDKSKGEVAVESLTKDFGENRSIFFVCDVSKTEEFTEIFKKIMDLYERVDILINNAGIGDETKWELMIDINYKAMVCGTFLFMEHMGKHKGGQGGTILNISSTAGVAPLHVFPVYAGTKHAVVGFSLSLKESYEETGVRILVMCPGCTITWMTRDLSNNYLESVYKNSPFKMIMQRVEHVAEYVVKLIEKGKNGAVWVVENNEPAFTFKNPHYLENRVPID